MTGLPTQLEREQAINDLKEMQERIQHLDRETLLSVRAALLDFGSKYRIALSPIEH